MIHRTYRSLDAPVKLVGFTLRQWLAILAGAGLVIGLVVAADLPAKAAISLCTVLIGVPVAMTYVSENGGLQLTTMLRDCVRWRLGAHELPVACPRRARTPGVVIEADALAASEPEPPDPGRAMAAGWYVTRNVADTFPLVGTSCGSPTGIVLGMATPGRTVERLDPFDPQHENHLTLINGMSGSGKTMLTVVLLARAVAQGAVGWIIDRAGHFDFLISLIPGARTVAVGGGGHAINPWDVPDPGRVESEKVDYLLSLHALLLGEHHADRDQYGLSDLEQNLLGLAITRVYDRCDLTGEQPRELLLQEELYQREADEKQAGATEIAAALRNLAIRLNNYVLDGPYAYLADLPTTVPNDAPLVVFDTRQIPEAKAAAALFVICEHVKSRIEERRRTHLSGRAAGDGWAGRSLLVIDEAWKLIERPATGRWFNEFVRRSRHYALWLVAISQQLSDFDNPHGRALLANAAMKVFLRQQSGELAYARAEIRLSDEEVQTISSLRTAKRDYALAYVINGTRGRGTVQIKVGAREYWTATSDPDRDEPLRQQALRESDGDAWQALALLADPHWHRRPAAAVGEARR